MNGDLGGCLGLLGWNRRLKKWLYKKLRAMSLELRASSLGISHKISGSVFNCNIRQYSPDACMTAAMPYRNSGNSTNGVMK